MRTKFWPLLAITFFALVLSSGCAAQKKSQKMPQESYQAKAQDKVDHQFYRYLNPLTYLDAGNQFMIEMTGFWSLGMGTVEYSGDKFEELHQYVGDVYQSL